MTPHRAIGSKELGVSRQVVPDSATDVTTVDSWISAITVANTTGSNVTFLVLDKQSSAKTLVPTVVISPNTIVILEWAQPTFMEGGIRWQAGTASALHAEIIGWKVG